jgi:predicted Zn-dependent protease
MDRRQNMPNNTCCLNICCLNTCSSNFFKKITATTHLVLVLLITPFVTTETAFSQSTELPELGDSATQHLSPIQESAIGKNFYRRLVTNPAFVDDYELRDYIQTLGENVGQYAELRGIPLTLSLVKDNSLNAFAVPGGYITFHSGLIMATDSESELASVLGHEIAHLTQRHLPRLLAKADEQKIPSIAAIVASILVGGQAGVAGLTATTAALASNQLRYSREFEKEADAVGIGLMADAKYDPLAMAEFFGKLEKFTRHDNTEIPEFLKTHPLSYTRVSESEIRASKFPKVSHQSSFEYYLSRAKIQSKIVERQDDPLLFFKDQSQSNIEFERHAALYGETLVYLENRQILDAGNSLRPLLSTYPTHPWIQTLQAKIEIEEGNIDQAINRFKSVAEANPAKVFLQYHLALSYLSNDQPELAKKAIRYQIRRHRNDPELYDLLAQSNVALKKVAEAHQAKAEYHAILGNYGKAVAVLKLAQKETLAQSYLGQSIQARIPELEEMARLQKSASDI